MKTVRQYLWIFVFMHVCCTLNSASAQEIDFKALINKAEKAVVPIMITIGQRPRASGTGFLISDDGYILTCAHVVEPPHSWQRDQTQIIVILKKHLLLFETDVEFGALLDKYNRLPTGLRQAFEENGFPLSDNVTVDAGRQENRWILIDRSHEQTYSIQREGERLNVYQYMAKAELIDSDTDKDIALIKIDAVNLKGEAVKLKPIALGDSDKVERYDNILALGYPLGLNIGIDEIVPSDGKVTALRTIGGNPTIQLDATVNPGNSGGPLINAKGEVVGIVNSRLSGVTERGDVITGLNFAVPINLARELIADAEVTLLNTTPSVTEAEESSTPTEPTPSPPIEPAPPSETEMEASTTNRTPKAETADDSEKKPPATQGVTDQTQGTTAEGNDGASQETSSSGSSEASQSKGETDQTGSTDSKEPETSEGQDVFTFIFIVGMAIIGITALIGLIVFVLSRRHRVCPRCGQVLPADHAHCPACAPATGVGQLIAITGRAKGRAFPLKSGQTVLGREIKTCDILLDDHSASRQHAVINSHENQFTITDLQSSNGTFVNGEPIARRALRDADQVQIGDTVFQFRSLPPQ